MSFMTRDEPSGCKSCTFVFMDDNPAERAQVRRALPMVAVPELPDDVSYYSRVMSYSGYFESINFAEEDRQRADEYQVNKDRSELRLKTRDLTEYLETLDMQISFKPFDNVGRSRITHPLPLVAISSTVIGTV